MPTLTTYMDRGKPLIKLRIAKQGTLGLGPMYVGGIPVIGLIDTGADSVIISPTLATKLDLLTVGERDVYSADSVKSSLVYEHVEIAIDRFSNGHSWCCNGIVPIEQSLPIGYDMLIGMTVLSRLNISFYKTGVFQLTM